MEQINDCGARAAAAIPASATGTTTGARAAAPTRMIEISKREEFYQQEYCGCVYSLRDTNRHRRNQGRAPDRDRHPVLSPERRYLTASGAECQNWTTSRLEHLHSRGLRRQARRAERQDGPSLCRAHFRKRAGVALGIRAVPRSADPARDRVAGLYVRASSRGGPRSHRRHRQRDAKADAGRQAADLGRVLLRAWTFDRRYYRLAIGGSLGRRARSKVRLVRFDGRCDRNRRFGHVPARHRADQRVDPDFGLSRVHGDPARREGDGGSAPGPAFPARISLRILRALFGVITRSWHMYPLGLLFGLGFDTASEVGLLGISAAQGSAGL